jgi:hypothetical protein
MTRDELRTWLSPLPDEAILALTLYGEARGEPIEGIIAVGCVIRNRVNDTKKRWPNTYRGVCLQPWQFSALNVTGGGVNHDRVIAMAKKLRGGGRADHGAGGRHRQRDRRAQDREETR